MLFNRKVAYVWFLVVVVCLLPRSALVTCKYKKMHISTCNIIFVNFHVKMMDLLHERIDDKSESRTRGNNDLSTVD